MKNLTFLLFLFIAVLVSGCATEQGNDQGGGHHHQGY